MKYKVKVEKLMYAHGSITVDCDSEYDAVKLVLNNIQNNVLTPDDIKWEEPKYAPRSLDVTGDVETICKVLL